MKIIDALSRIHVNPLYLYYRTSNNSGHNRVSCPTTKKVHGHISNLISFRDVQIFPNKLNRNFSHMSSKYCSGQD